MKSISCSSTWQADRQPITIRIGGRVIHDPAFIFIKRQTPFEPFLAPTLPMDNQVENNRQDAFEIEIINRGIIFEERKKSHAEATHLHGIGGHAGFQFGHDGTQRRGQEDQAG